VHRTVTTAVTTDATRLLPSRQRMMTVKTIYTCTTLTATDLCSTHTCRTRLYLYYL